MGLPFGREMLACPSRCAADQGSLLCLLQLVRVHLYLALSPPTAHRAGLAFHFPLTMWSKEMSSEPSVRLTLQHVVVAAGNTRLASGVLRVPASGNSGVRIDETTLWLGAGIFLSSRDSENWKNGSPEVHTKETWQCQPGVNGIPLADPGQLPDLASTLLLPTTPTPHPTFHGPSILPSTQLLV